MQEVKFKYIYPDSYNPQYINGAVGSIDPSGEITINFYHERAPIPKIEFRDLSSEGTPLESFRLEPSNLDTFFIRNITSGITMNYSTSKALYEWLGEQLEIYEKRKENV